MLKVFSFLASSDDRLDLRHGLGLILVRQIVDAHKGTMQIEGKEQKGCKVTLGFPIVGDHHQESPCQTVGSFKIEG